MLTQNCIRRELAVIRKLRQITPISAFFGNQDSITFSSIVISTEEDTDQIHYPPWVPEFVQCTQRYDLSSPILCLIRKKTLNIYTALMILYL